MCRLGLSVARIINLHRSLICITSLICTWTVIPPSKIVQKWSSDSIAIRLSGSSFLPQWGLLASISQLQTMSSFSYAPLLRLVCILFSLMLRTSPGVLKTCNRYGDGHTVNYRRGMYIVITCLPTKRLTLYFFFSRKGRSVCWTPSSRDLPINLKVSLVTLQLRGSNTNPGYLQNSITSSPEVISLILIWKTCQR